MFSTDVLFSGMNVQLVRGKEGFQVVAFISALAPVAGDIQLTVSWYLLATLS